jgi:glycosyltransferase involved in cell wall biosynthesis
MEKNTDISIVIPLLNEEESLNELTERIVKQLNDLNKTFELIFIDDGSTDASFDILAKLKKRYRQITIIRFRRNFGKSAALSEGFKKASGEFVFTMDADLQDDPAEIPKMLEAIKKGYDLISGWKKERHDPIGKTLPSKFFNFTTRRLTGIKIHDFNCGFKLYRRDVIKSIPVYGEMHRYLPVLAHWQGFKVGEMVVKHHSRQFGVSKFGFRRIFHGFFDLLTVLFITRYRQKPLHFFGFIGLLFNAIGGGILAWLTAGWFLGSPIGNRPILFLGLLLIIVGVQSFTLGFIAEMITNSRDQKIEYSIREIVE